MSTSPDPSGPPCAPRWETRPLDDLQSLYRWRPEEDLGPIRPEALAERSHVAFRADAGEDFDSVSPVPSRPPPPRTLLCHDMKGGYLEDRFCAGAEDCAEAPYVLRAWAAVDAFVYFSHHLVTPPPTGWITAAHRHGVKCLGTFITEWKPGRRVCEEVLSGGAESRRRFAEALARMAQASGFDGWLVNVENELAEEDASEGMVKLVGELTEAMHRLVPGSLVIWYDAVTVEGKLQWQNELNGLNSPFFQACDGIFLNYTWKVPKSENNETNADSLANSLSHLEEGCQSRRQDVYVGVDVFGRGCYGGGGFNCGAALEIIRSYNLSVALFAPGWTHERAPRAADRPSREHAFWRLLRKHVFLRGLKLEVEEIGGAEEGPSPGTSSRAVSLPPPPCLFSSCFSAGYGRRRRGKGKGEGKPGPASKEIKEKRGVAGGTADSPSSDASLAAVDASPPSVAAAKTTTTTSLPAKEGGGEETAAAASSKEKTRRKGSWWLDMTRQEFQSSFSQFLPLPDGEWPGEAPRDGGEDGGSHDYCLLLEADPSSGEGGGVCLQVSPKERGGSQEGEGGKCGKINAAAVVVPLLLCELCCNGGDVELAFSVSHGGGGGAGLAGVRLRVTEGGGGTVTAEATPRTDLAGTLPRGGEEEEEEEEEGFAVSCYSAALKKGSTLVAVGLAVAPGTERLVARSLKIFRLPDKGQKTKQQ